MILKNTQIGKVLKKRMSKEIKITCKSQKTMPLDELVDFQGNLKALSPEAENRIRQSILKHGFTFPVFVWGHSILDGHQRIFALRKMIEEGYTIGPIPVDEIEAKNEKDAP